MAKKQHKEKFENKVASSTIEKAAVKSFFSWKDRALIGVICFTAYLTFSNVKNYQFVNWDDDRNFYENPLITSLNAENFWQNTVKIFKSDVIGNYNPLTIWTFALEKRLYGKGSYNGLESPGQWHHTNVLLHLICVWLVYLISRRLRLGLIGAGFVAALFALHPMRVESVAWVTERKDVLYGMFFLAAMYQYIRTKTNPTLWRYVLIYLFFGLSLLSKIQAVALPLVMVAIDFLLDEKFELKSVINKWPYFLISFLWGVLGIVVLGSEGSLDTNDVTYPFWQRIFIGSFSYMVYLVKSVIPYELSPLYPYPPRRHIFLSNHCFGANCWLFGLDGLHQGLEGIWLCLVFLYFQHYLPLTGIRSRSRIYCGQVHLHRLSGAVFWIWLVAGKIGGKQGASKALATRIGVLVIGVYSFITYKQVAIWENSGTLWTHVLKYYDKTTLPFGNRANFYRSQKKYDEALVDYNKAISLKEDPQTYNSRARLYFDTANDSTRLLLALKDYNRAIELKPNDGEFWVNRGATYARLGNLEKAIENINTGLKFKPDHLNRLPQPIRALNSALAARFPLGSTEYGQYTTLAIADLDEYQKYRPYNGDTWYEKARMKRTLGNLLAALDDINRAIQIDASKGIYFYERAIENHQLTRKEFAKADLETAISLGYANIDAELAALYLSN